MMYANGNNAKLGDKVRLWNGRLGIVVCSMDTNEYTPAYPKAEWEYLKQGLLIKADNGEVFHYVEADEDIEIVERADARAA
ncbi:MAG: hypothetical protein PHE55_06935 [Methylococcaceae bacterium]|nr:hypothetical protein [Methylococcaceae bacterium]